MKLLICLAGGVALFAAKSASAGLLFTVDALVDFTFDGAEVVYDANFHDLSASQNAGFRLTNKSSVDTAGQDRLYFSGELSGDGTPPLSFDIRRSSGGTGSNQTLLSGVLESMEVDAGNGRFDFLVKGGTISGPSAGEYSGRGMYVTIAGIGGTEWLGMYQSLTNPVVAQNAAVNASVKGVVATAAAPAAAPAPGTLALLLTAMGIPLISVVRRN